MSKIKIVHGDIIYYGDNLKGIKIVNEFDPLSLSLIVGTADITFFSKTSPPNFSNDEPIKIYFDDKLMAMTFLTEVKKTGKYLWSIKTEDIISYLERFTFLGDIYSEKSSFEIVNEIMALTPFEVGKDWFFDDVLDIPLSGHIPVCNCREALSQILFAIGGYIDTSFKFGEEISFTSIDTEQYAVYIPKNRIMQGQTMEDKNKTSCVELISHTYSHPEDGESTDGLGTGYFWTPDTISATDLLILYPKPLYSRSTSKNSAYIESYVEKEETANSIIIDYEMKRFDKRMLRMWGYAYEHTTNTHSKCSSATGNTVAIENKTLVSSSNAQDVLNRCYKFLVGTQYVTSKIRNTKRSLGDGNVLYDFVHLGDMITLDVDNYGETNTVTGMVVKTQYSLIGNAVVKDCKIQILEQEVNNGT